MKASPLFTKTYDLLIWLIPQAQKFPRQHRFTLAEKIQKLGMAFQDEITAAGKTKGDQRLDRLYQADITLAQLRIWVRFAKDLDCLSIRQFEHVSRMEVEVGKLLGAWIKSTNK